MSRSECSPDQSLNKPVNVWQRIFGRKKPKYPAPTSNFKQNNAFIFILNVLGMSLCQISHIQMFS